MLLSKTKVLPSFCSDYVNLFVPLEIIRLTAVAGEQDYLTLFSEL